MHSRLRFLAALPAFLCPTWTAYGQAPDGSSRAAPDVGFAASARQGCGLQPRTEGGFEGVGPRYFAGFDERGFTLNPVLGPHAPRELPWRYEVESYGRGEARVAFAEKAEVHCAGARELAYDYPGIRATYEVREDGVKQSFVFEALPPGRGDLVVRGRIETELSSPLRPEGAPTLAYSHGDVGIVHVGAVLGIDAAGRTCAGTLHALENALEYRLPAWFVDSARLPLVLDPLIGTAVTLDNTPLLDDVGPDLAYDDTNNTWLAVFQRSASGAAFNLVAQRLDTSGALIGGAIVVESGAAAAGRPRVASLNASNRFVVLWEENGDVKARAIDAATGALSGTLNVATGTDAQREPVIAGDTSTSEDEALAFWRNETLDAIEAVQIEARSDGSFSRSGSTITLESSTSIINNVGKIAVSRSGGASGRYGFVFESFNQLVPNELRGGVVDRDLNVVVADRRLIQNALVPDVDGDGEQWVVAFEVADTGNVFLSDVQALGWRLQGASTSVTAPVVIENGANDDEVNPCVAWLGNSALVVYADAAATGFDVDVLSIDPFTCTRCEGGSSADTAGNDAFPRVAARRASGENSDFAAVAWTAQIDGATFFRNVLWMSWDSTDGATSNVGGGCTGGGTAHATCPRQGNALFAFTLRAATANASAFLILGDRTLNASCGGCTLVPDPFTGFVESAGTTDAQGDAAFALALPNDPSLSGLGATAQFLVSGNGCLATFFTSSAIRFTIE